MVFRWVFHILINNRVQQLVGREVPISRLDLDEFVIDKLVQGLSLVHVVLILGLKQLSPLLQLQVAEGELLPANLGNDLLYIDGLLRI